MKKILNFNLPIIPLDKANHFVYGFIIFFVSQLIITIVIINSNININIISFIITLIFALSKEIKDQIVYKGFSWYDLIITMIPSLSITLLSVINSF